MPKENIFTKSIIKSLMKEMNIEYHEIDNTVINIESYKDYLNKTRQNFIDYNIDSYEITGYIIIGKFLQTKTFGYKDCQFYAYVIKNKESTELCISISKMNPNLWYRFKEYKECRDIPNILEIYTPESYHLEYTKSHKGCMGSESILQMTVTDLETYILIHPFTEILLWGPVWDDFPFRDNYENENINKEQHMVYSIHAMKQTSEIYTFSVKTLFSFNFNYFRKSSS